MEKEEEEKEEDDEKEEEEEHQRRRSWSHETGGGRVMPLEGGERENMQWQEEVWRMRMVSHVIGGDDGGEVM